MVDATAISAAAGMLLSLGFSYIPGVKQRWKAQSGTEKRMYMGMLILIVGMGVFILSCGGLVGWIGCERAGASQLIEQVVFALVANQSIYGLTNKGEEASDE